MNVAVIVAQLAADHPALYSYGPMGVMLGWFLLRGEKLAARIIHELGDMKETMLLDVVSRAYAPQAVREMAQDKLDAIEAKRKKRDSVS